MNATIINSGSNSTDFQLQARLWDLWLAAPSTKLAASLSPSRWCPARSSSPPPPPSSPVVSSSYLSSLIIMFRWWEACSSSPPSSSTSFSLILQSLLPWKSTSKPKVYTILRILLKWKMFTWFLVILLKWNILLQKCREAQHQECINQAWDTNRPF